MYIDVTDLALFIHNEQRALCKSFRAKHTIFQRGMPMRPEIAQQRIRNAAQRFGPGLNGWNGVDTHAQDLSIVPGKLGEIFLVCRHLDRSDGSEGERIERQDDVLLAPETGKCHLVIQMRLQSEIRSKKNVVLAFYPLAFTPV